MIYRNLFADMILRWLVKKILNYYKWIQIKRKKRRIELVLFFLGLGKKNFGKLTVTTDTLQMTSADGLKYTDFIWIKLCFLLLTDEISNQFNARRLKLVYCFLWWKLTSGTLISSYNNFSFSPYQTTTSIVSDNFLMVFSNYFSLKRFISKFNWV